ncbi:MAG: dienelactone hydrolase [Chryseobacterium sp.]|nr:dienelactone hydrolase [Chryseobacterium sp.]
MRKIGYTILLLISTYSCLLAQIKNVNQISKRYTDISRGNRLLLTEIWYPEDLADETSKETFDISKTAIRKHPLVLLSHGTGGNRFSLTWLANILAGEGFIVASVDHFGNTTDNKIPEYFVRYWERPLDISFVMDQLLEDPNFSDIIDHNRLAVVGFSLGGYTSLALAGARLDCSLFKKAAKSKQGKQELNVPEMGDLTQLIDRIDCKQIPKVLKDDRVKAFVALSPALGLGFSTEDQFNVEAPVLIIGTEGDTITPIKSNAIKYHRFIPTSQIKVLKRNLGHYIFLPKLKEYSPDEAIFFKDPQGVDRTKVHQEVGRIIVDFLDKSL